MVLFGSNGTGKTIVLFQCLVMLISSLKLEGKHCEVLVMVGADSIKDPTCWTSSPKHGLKYCGKQDCEGSELLYDLKTKYLDSVYLFKDVQPTTFEKSCQEWKEARTLNNVFTNFLLMLPRMKGEKIQRFHEMFQKIADFVKTTWNENA